MALEVDDIIIENLDGVLKAAAGVVSASATTADLPDSANKRYVTDAQLTVIGNTSGTNSGNETTATLGATINGSAAAVPNDTDLVATVDTSVVKKITWTNVKAFLKTYFDTIYLGIAATAAAATVLATARKINGVSFNGSADIVTDAMLNIVTGLGGTIKSVNPFGFGGQSGTGLTDNRCFFQAVWLPNDATITGVSWMQVVQGNYTSDNYNGVGLYTYSGGTLTLVASSTDDGTIWKAAAAAYAKKAFTSTYVATAGLYFIAALYCQSALVTNPSLHATSSAIQSGHNTLDLTNSAKLAGYISGLTALPATQASSGLTADSAPKLFMLY